MTSEIVKPTGDMIVKMEETVESETLEKSCVASSGEYGCSCICVEGSKTDASTVGRPMKVTCIPGSDTLRGRHQDVQNVVTQVFAGGIPEHRIQECV